MRQSTEAIIFSYKEEKIREFDESRRKIIWNGEQVFAEI